MKENYDVLIIGTGVAGLYAALQFDGDISVLAVSKREFELSNSSLAQGGVAAVLDKNHDNYRLHIGDTLIAGKFKNNLSAVEKLVSEGPADVMRLKEIGARFDTEESGELSKTLEAGHSRNRIVHHKDSTGKEIVDTLLREVAKKPGVDMLDNTLVYELDKIENGVRKPDDFRHEHYLLIEEHGKRILISGCSHKGVINIVHWFRPDVLVGGFHFHKLPLGETLTGYARQLDAYGTAYYTCHCTGVPQYAYMKQTMRRLHYLSAGDTIKL